MQTCSKCRGAMAPKINMDGDVSTVLKRLAAETDNIVWFCPKCGVERGGKLRGADVDQATAYIRRQKKQWWQFWIR